MGRTIRKLPSGMGCLTYPSEFTLDRKVWKRDLDCFLKRMARIYPDVGAIWKLEFQKRGAPHYHLTFWGAPLEADDVRAFLEFRQWIAQNWFEVVGSSQQAHRYAGTSYEEVYAPEGCMNYHSKYMCKDELPESVQNAHVGRWWGCHNRAKIPFAPEYEIPLEKHEAQFILRVMRRSIERLTRSKKTGRFRRRRCRASNGLVLLCDASFWAHRLEPLCDLANSIHVLESNKPF